MNNSLEERIKKDIIENIDSLEEKRNCAFSFIWTHKIIKSKKGHTYTATRCTDTLYTKDSEFYYFKIKDSEAYYEAENGKEFWDFIEQILKERNNQKNEDARKYFDEKI